MVQAPTDDVEVCLLGPLAVSCRGEPVEVPGRRERAVLALLAAEVGQPVGVDRLTALLWGHDPPPSADKGLQTFVSRLRHALGDLPGRLVRRERAYVLDLPAGATDLGRFRDGLREGTAALEAGEADRAVDVLAAAVGLWRGDRPADLGETPTAAAVARRLVAERTAAVEALAAARLAAGDPDTAVAELEAELGTHPVHEPHWALLMRAQVAAGRPAAAVEAFERARRRLADELGLDPSPALADLHQRVLRGEPTTVATPPFEVVADASADEAPEPGRADPRVRPPPMLTRLVGRDGELADLRSALDSDRLVTVVGVGGVGKTRLAVEAVATAADVAWCDLTRVGVDDAVADAAARAVGVVPPPGVSPWDATAGALAGTATTLVVDNCEHVLDGVRAVVVGLLQACPELTVLATSRQPLGIAGEHVRTLSPLDTDAGGPAVALFTAAVERAGGRLDGEELDGLGTVCRRLDGLPLALELAAPVVRTLGLAAVSDGLEQRFELLDATWDATGRERDLRGTVAWSEALLPPSLRDLLRAVSVFAGPFTADMVDEVCAPDLPDVTRALGALVDRCLVEPVAGTPRRFRLLENVRAYGRDALGEPALAALRDRHAAWIAARCDRVYEQLWVGDEVPLLRSVTRVDDEVRAAVDWVLATDDATTGLRIAAGLHAPMWLGLRTDLAAWVRQLLERFGDRPAPRQAGAWAGWAQWLLVAEGDGDGAAEAAARATAAVGDGPAPDVLWAYRVEVAARAYDVAAAHELLDAAVADGISDGWRRIIEAGLTPIEEALGLADLAAERWRRMAAEVEATGSMMESEMLRMGLALLDHPEDAERVLDVLRDVLAQLLEAEHRFLAQLVTMVTATFAGRSGDRELAVATFEDVLGRWAAVGAWRYEWNTIREVTTLLGGCGAHEDVIVLETAAGRSTSAPGLIGEQGDLVGAAVVTARAELSPEALAAAEQRGAAMGDRDALAHARGALARLHT